jgi:hypothetical protein
MLLSLATGIIYFVFAVTGLSLSAGLAVLIIGVPFFLVFVAVSRVVSLAEGRLIEAMTGERMPRRPVYQGKAQAFWTRIVDMLKDRRTWTTIAYFILMLPIGIAYFVTAVVGLSVSLAFIFAPLADILSRAGVAGFGDIHVTAPGAAEWIADSVFVLPLLMLLGVLLLTSTMHVARGVGRLHALFAKTLLVARAAPTEAAANAESPAPLAAH